MAGDESGFAPKNVSSGCVFSLVAAALAGLAAVIILWFVVARVEPEAAPEGEGPVEAAEPPMPGE
ncbi:MAG TPA: hypothetical protein VF170_10800 [Planctomycetaceae bacterium]